MAVILSAAVASDCGERLRGRGGEKLEVGFKIDFNLVIAAT